MKMSMVQLREKLGYTQDAVVQHLEQQFNIKITRQYYGMIEQGKRTPGLKVAIALAELLDASVRDIFFDTKATKCCVKGYSSTN